MQPWLRTFLEKYSSGRRGAPAKGVGRVTGAEVQIFSSPPNKKGHQIGVLFYLTTKREGTFICNFIANEVHKRGKSRCLLASIRLAEVLFRKKKPLLFSAVLSFLCALLKGGHPPILHLIRQETYSFPTRGRLFFFRFFATLD